MQVRFTWSKN